MRRRLRLKTAILLIASLGLIFPARSQADGPSAAALSQQAPIQNSPVAAASVPRIIDVALDATGRLSGQAVDSAGLPAAGKTIVVASQGREAAHTTTDATGHFAIDHLAGGVYEIHCGDSGSLARLWAPHTAPPAARSTLTVQYGEPVVRGQHTFGQHDGSWLKGRGPWLIAAAAIVAVPTALALGLKPRSPAS